MLSSKTDQTTPARWQNACPGDLSCNVGKLDRPRVGQKLLDDK
jgi:hypothetical protein